MELLELTHGLYRLLAQSSQPVNVLGFVIDLVIELQRSGDLVVRRQFPRLRQPGLPRRLALGERVVLDPILRHEPRGQMRDTAACGIAPGLPRHTTLSATSWNGTRTAGFALPRAGARQAGLRPAFPVRVERTPRRRNRANRCHRQRAYQSPD